MNMEQVQEERYVFQTEWFDKQADLIRSYLLTFYPGDNSIDMVSTPRAPLAHPARAPLAVRFEKQTHVPQENGVPQY